MSHDLTSSGSLRNPDAPFEVATAPVEPTADKPAEAVTDVKPTEEAKTDGAP